MKRCRSCQEGSSRVTLAMVADRSLWIEQRSSVEAFAIIVCRHILMTLAEVGPCVSDDEPFNARS
jgi:hypothetical protein